MQYMNRTEFLHDFTSKGCYLVDLFKKRGRTVHKVTPKEKEIAVVALSSFIREVKPVIVVAVLKRINKLAQKAVNRSQISLRYEVLPYPTRNCIAKYTSGLKGFLSELSLGSEA